MIGGPVNKKEALDRLISTGRAELVALTDEEMASVGADADTPFRPPELPERLRVLSDEARTAVLSTALRSLIARGLIQPPSQETAPAAESGGRVDLHTILAVRRAPTAVVFVGQASYLAALHGFREGDRDGFLEERIDDRGIHHFTLRTTDDTVEGVVALADPEGLTPADVPDGEEAVDIPDDVTDAMRTMGPGMTRLEAYHSRPTGVRRAQLSVLVRSQGTSVVRSVFGVDPSPPRLVPVSAKGLREVIRDTLTDPAGAASKNGARADPHGYRCPVCGYPDLAEPPRTEEGGGSFEICPSCGYQFGVTDDDRDISYEEWRGEWVAGGMKWWSRGRRQPPEWDPQAQLRAVQEGPPPS
jgi:hypothetical protein